jgi:thiamine transport system permease protein
MVVLHTRLVGQHDARVCKAVHLHAGDGLAPASQHCLRSWFRLLLFDFGVILVLGGPRVGTLETEIYRQAVYMFNLPAAAILSGVQLVATALVMYMYSRIQSRLSVIQNLKPEGAPGKRPRSFGEWLQVFLLGIVPTAALMLPMGALLAGSFLTRAGPSFASGGRA